MLEFGYKWQIASKIWMDEYTSVSNSGFENPYLFVIRRVIVIGVLATIIAASAYAQDGPPRDLIQWKGSLDLIGEYSTYTPLYQSIPATYGYLYSKQEIGIDGIPFKGDLFLPSYQTSSLSRVSFSFDSDALKSSIQERVKKKITTLQEVPSIDALSQKIEDASDPKQYEQLRSVNDKLSNGALGMDVSEYNSIHSMQSQLSRYNPAEYSQYEEYLQLKSMDPDAGYHKELKTLREQGILNSAEALWYNFDAFQVGTTAPYFSDLDLAAVPVIGYYGAYSSPYFYVAASDGKALNFDIRDTLMSYSRDLTAYKLGAGTAQRSHLYLSYLHGEDQATVAPDPMVSNTVGGFDGRLLLFKNRLDLQARSYLGLYTSDSEAQRETNTINPDDLSSIKGLGTWLAKDVNLNSSTVSGKASHVRMLFQGKDLKVSGEFRRVDPTYHSVGLAYLQSDLQRIQLSVEKYAFNKKVKFYGKLRMDEDNLNGVKQYTGRNTNGLIRVHSNFKKLPNLSLTYMPNIYQSTPVISGEKRVQESHMIMLASSKSYRFLKMNQMTSGSLTYNLHKRQAEGFSSINTSVNQIITISKKINTAIQLLYRQTNTSYYWSVRPTVRYRVAKKGTAHISFRYGQDYFQHTRYAFDIGTRLKINEKLIFALSLIQNYYSTTGSLNDLRIRTSIRALW